jgi:YVTN family beta-propeller protein
MDTGLDKTGFRRMSLGLPLTLMLVGPLAIAQSTGATFGDVIRLGGTPSDLVLDEARGRLYLVNSNTNQVSVYDYANNSIVSSLYVGTTPVAAAISMDSRYLYVSNNGSASLSVIDLTRLQVIQTVSLPANPEGVEVGADGRALVTVEGSSTSTSITSLYLFDVT